MKGKIVMKRIASLIITLLIIISLSATAFAEVGFSDNFIEYDAEAGIISVSYTGYTEEYEASAVVYDVTKVKDPTVNTEYIDEATTPIIAIMQESADGTFDLNIKNDYTGRVILVIGSMDGSSVRTLLKIEDGTIRSIVIPKEVLADFDADGSMTVLGPEDTVTVKNGLLKNAVIDATEGAVEIGTTSVTGKIRFNLNGKITAEPGDTVMLQSVVSEGKRNIGFVKGFKLNGEYDISLVVTASNGRTWSAKYATKDIIGNALISAAIQNVPIEETITGIEIVPAD